jgi:periplasmic divalent cation tolerance protein
MPMAALICFRTCPESHTAERIATALVDEALLLVKASAEAYPALQERLRALHPYELPELLAVETACGLPEYLHWVADETRHKD